MNGRTLNRIALASLVALALAACGGDAGEDATTTLSADAGAEETTTTEAAPEATTTPDSGEGEGSTDGGGDVSGVCLNAAQAMSAAVSSYSTGLAGAMGGALDDEELQEIADQLHAMAEAAPDAIKDDLEVIANEIGAFYEAWAEIGFTGAVAPTPDQVAQLEALGEAIDQDAFDEAAENIQTWFDDNC